jgi:hypothetical protein
MNKFGEVPKLNLKQKIVLNLNHAVFYKYVKPNGDLGFSPVYVVRCCRHGLFLDTLHGFDGHFECDLCYKVFRERCLA